MGDVGDLFIVRFERVGNGESGHLIDCTRVENLGGLVEYPLQEGVAASDGRVNVAVRAASRDVAVTEARKRADAYPQRSSGQLTVPSP